MQFWTVDKPSVWSFLHIFAICTLYLFHIHIYLHFSFKSFHLLCVGLVYFSFLYFCLKSFSSAPLTCGVWAFWQNFSRSGWCIIDVWRRGSFAWFEEIVHLQTFSNLSFWNASNCGTWLIWVFVGFPDVLTLQKATKDFALIPFKKYISDFIVRHGWW